MTQTAMSQIIFGRTNLTVGRTGFGCIPIQRISFAESTALLRCAYEAGISLYDTAATYTNSEERIGVAFSVPSVREKIVLCTKSNPSTAEELAAKLDNSLKMLQTDYIDVYQFHNPSGLHLPGGELYDFLARQREKGKIRHIGISSHKLDMAVAAVKSGFYSTLQFPLSYLSTDEELQIIELCREHNVGLLAMKGLCGGILQNARAAFAFLRQYENVIPIWGMQFMHELEEFLAYENSPPVPDAALWRTIESDRRTLGEKFCRGCGYCLPCPAKIPITAAARMKFLLGRTSKAKLLTPEMAEKMARIDNCINCGHCRKHCPYELDVPGLLREHYEGFKEAYHETNKKRTCN